MPPAPRGSEDNTIQPMQRLLVFVAEPGADVTDEDESTEWHVAYILRRAGMEPDQALLIKDLGVDSSNAPLQDRTLTEEQDRKVEIWTMDPDGEREHPLFAGRMLIESLRIDPTGEFEQVLVVLAPWMYGDPLPGEQVWNSLTEDVQTVDFDPEFNPEVDGLTLRNRRLNNDDEEERTGKKYALWIDPESARTATAVESAQDLPDILDVKFWDVGDFVGTLMWWLNDREDNVRNYPHHRESRHAQELFDEAPLLRNEVLKRGTYLPECLQRILPRYGFNFVTECGADDEGGREKAQPYLRVFKRGDGREKQLKLQPRDEDVDSTRSHLSEFELTTDLAAIANTVIVQGALQEREVTVELYRAWPEDDDELTSTQLNRHTGAEYAAHPEAWRKWVWNEGGDYCELRTDTLPIPETPPDLSSVFDEDTVPKRRAFEDTLTWRFDEQTMRRPAYLQYSINAGGTWHDVPESAGYRVLRTECGIEFTGEDIWSTLRDAGDDALLRITATVRGDRRIEYIETRHTASPLTEEVELWLDFSDRFFDRARAEGEFASLLEGDHDARDDADDMETVGTNLVENVQAADTRAVIRLEGLRTDYQVSDVLTDVDGRAIELVRTVPTSGTTRYVQVVGLRWDYPAQRTELIVAPFDR